MILHSNNDCTLRRAHLVSLVAAIVGSASAFSSSLGGGVSSSPDRQRLSPPRASSSSKKETVVGWKSSSIVISSHTRQRRRSSFLNYRSSIDVDDGLDRYYDIGIADSFYKQVEEQTLAQDFIVDEDNVDDPLSRALTRRTVHHHDHFPDAIRDLLSSIPFPSLPPSWVVTSEAMEALVGGAGGAGVLMHLHNAGEAFGLPLCQTVTTEFDVDSTNARNESSTATTTATTMTKTQLRKEVVETAKAFVPVAVEFGVVDTLTRYFN